MEVVKKCLGGGGERGMCVFVSVCVYMLGVGMREGRWGEEVYDVFYLFINIDAMPLCHLFVPSMFQQCKFMNINSRLWLFDVVCLAVSVAIQFILKFWARLFKTNNVVS